MAARVASKPAGRADNAAVALKVAPVFALGLLMILAGCQAEPASRPPKPPAEMVDGYAYTAMLVSRHPLWGALRDLEAALADLGDDEWDPALPPIEDRFEDVAFIESYALGDQEPRMAALRRDWRADYPPLQLPANGLAEDQEARIDWEHRQAERMVRRSMAQARSAESRRLAQLRARLVEKYQERLTNLSIEVAIRDTEAAQAAGRERERVWQTIEAEVEATRVACEEQLAELETQLRAQAAERVEQARRRADVISGEREVTMRAAGAGLYDQMIGQMQQSWPQPGEDEATVLAESGAAPANERLGEIGTSREAAEAARVEKIAEQREGIQQALGRLRVKIRAGTETAAKIVAYRNGIRLQTLPGGRRQGRDVTGMVAAELDDFWAVAGD